jgi:hypothetical protein
MYNPHRGFDASKTNTRFSRMRTQLHRLETTSTPYRETLAATVKALRATPGVEPAREAALVFADQDGVFPAYKLERWSGKTAAAAALTLLCLEGRLAVSHYSHAGNPFYGPAPELEPPRRRGREPAPISRKLKAMEVGESFQTLIKPTSIIGPRSWIRKHHPERQFIWSLNAMGAKLITRTQ